VATLYLASRSPRRRELLESLGLSFVQIDADIPEVPALDEPATDYVRRVALDKAWAVRKRTGDSVPILSADTEVVVDNHILGKPATLEEAVQMLHTLAGREHQVHTAVVLLTDKPVSVISSSRVWFKPLTIEQCRQYCLANKPLDKAGAYGIQDQAAGFITRFEGSYSAVMGLPLAQTRDLLGQLQE
jgi:septum formation protein